VYNGQKFIKLVIAKIIATTNNTSANVPEIIFIKYNTAIAMAIINRIVLSKEPMFFFIKRNLKVINID
jgi:hypothetical protein